MIKNRVEVLFNGYASEVFELSSTPNDSGILSCGVLPYVHANCSCSLITGEKNVIVDTMTPWDKEKILDALQIRNLKPEDIDYVISTHGHSDHTGNNNLFTSAKHIVGYCFSWKDQYYLHPFEREVALKLAAGIEVIATPGHTADDISLVVHTNDLGTVILAGDVFEREDDIEHPEIWRNAGSMDPERQEKSRLLIADLADYIVPGHGPMFKVTEAMKTTLKTAVYGKAQN